MTNIIVPDKYLITMSYLPEQSRNRSYPSDLNEIPLFERGILRGDTFNLGRSCDCGMSTFSWKDPSNLFFSRYQSDLFFPRSDRGIPGIIFKNIGSDVPYLITDHKKINFSFPDYTAEQIEESRTIRQDRLKTKDGIRILPEEKVLFVRSGLMLKIGVLR